MDFAWIVPLLALTTMLVVCIYAMMSKVAVEDRMDDPSVPKSTLAKDGPQGGVAMIDPDAAMTRQGRFAEPVLE